MNKPPPMGHNGGFAFDTRADIPKDVPRLFFFKCAIQDVLDDILKMPKDERGVYMTALLVMYKEMEGLPADDKMAAMSLGLDVREWRHIKPKLIARGVLYQRQSGRISNHRFEAEISAYVTEFKNRREAAVERELKKREAAKIAERSPRDRADIAERSSRDRRDVAAMSPTFPADIGEDFSKKHNEINGDDTTRQARDEHETTLRARDLLSTSYELPVREEGKRGQTSSISTVADAALEEVQPPRWIIHPDGSYSGTAFERFDASQIREMAVKWPHLDFPNVLCEIDDFLAPEFANQKLSIDHPSRLKRLEGLLSHKNANYKALADQIVSKTVVDTDDCWFDGDRLMVANGFKADLIGLVGGSEERLRITLDKAAASVPLTLKGNDLKRVVRGQFARNVDWDRRDDRKVDASRRGAASAGGGTATQPVESRADRIARQMRQAAEENRR